MLSNLMIESSVHQISDHTDHRAHSHTSQEMCVSILSGKRCGYHSKVGFGGRITSSNSPTILVIPISQSIAITLL